MIKFLNESTVSIGAIQQKMIEIKNKSANIKDVKHLYKAACPTAPTQKGALTEEGNKK